MNIFENTKEIEHYTDQKIWSDSSIDLYFRKNIHNNRSQIGLSGYSICKDQHSQFNYAQIQSLVDKTAQKLLFSGLMAGDVLALQLPNSIETQILFLACWQQGIAVAPLPSLWREKDIKQALIRISPQAYICPILHDGYNYTELMYHIGLDISSIKMLFSLGGSQVDGCLALDDVFMAEAANHDVALLKPDDYTKVDANSTCLVTFSNNKNGNYTPYYHTHNQLIAAANVFNSLTKPLAKNTIISPFAPTSMTICTITTICWALSDASLTCYDGLMATEFQNLPIDSAHFYLPHNFDEPKLVDALFEQGLDKLVFIQKINPNRVKKRQHSKILDVITLDEYAFIPQMRDQNQMPTSGQIYKYKLQNNVTDQIQLNEYETKSGQQAWQISCSFLPTNIIKNNGKFNSGLKLGKSNSQKLNIGNMALDFADMERDLLGFHGVEDAAILAVKDSLLGFRPVLTIVPKVGSVILHHELVEFLKNKQHSAYKIPQELYKIPNIPRDYDLNIIRQTSKQELLKLVGPRQSDGLLSVQQELASLLANA